MGKTKTKWGGFAKKAVSCAAAASLALCLTPAAAFAGDTLSETYPLPKASEKVGFQHKATDNGHEYTYEYVTVGSSSAAGTRVAPMMGTWYELIGLNYINQYRGVDSIFKHEANAASSRDSEVDSDYTTGAKGSLQSRNVAMAILGTSVNQNPDEYMWNYACWANGADVPLDSRSIDHGNGGVAAVSVTIDGTEYADFPRAIYSECNIIDATGNSDTYGDLNYAKWVELENARDNRPKTGEYDPYYSKLSVRGNGGASTVSQISEFARQMDGIIAQYQDANGNFTLQTRYGGNSATGTQETVAKIEDIIQATQYYTLAKIADATVEKAVTADLVGYDPATGNYACRVYAVDENDKDQNFYGGRLAGYLGDISTSITELGLEPAQDVTVEAEQAYVKWYTPQQIVENADAVFVCDAPSTNSVSTYLATAGDGEHHCVYRISSHDYPDEDETEALLKAREDATAAGKKAAKFCFSYPANTFGNFYAQGGENCMLALVTSSFAYPEIYGSQGLTDLMAYWAKYVWHVKDSSLQSIVTSACHYMSGDLEIVKISADYVANAEKYFNIGNNYYLQNMEAVDAINYGNLKAYDPEALAARTPAIEPEPEKADNPMTVKANKLKAQAKKKKTFKAAEAFTVEKAKGEVTYQKTSGDKKIKVSKVGNVTVKQGLKAGKTYKVKVTVTAAGNKNYKSGSADVTLKVAVK